MVISPAMPEKQSKYRVFMSWILTKRHGHNGTLITLAVMLLDIHSRIKTALGSAIKEKWATDPPEIALNQTPKIELGELATPVCFELAKRLKKAPRAVAEELIGACGTIKGVRK